LETRLDLAVVAVEQAEAREVSSAGDAAPLAAPGLQTLASGAVAASQAKLVVPAAAALAPLASPPPVRPAEMPASARVPATVPAVAAARPLFPSPEPVQELATTIGPIAKPVAPSPVIVAARAPAKVTVPSLATEGEAAPLSARPTPVAALAPTDIEATPVVLPHTVLSAAGAPGLALPARIPEAAVVPHAVPEPPRIGAASPRAIATSEAPRSDQVLPPRILDSSRAPEVIPDADAVTAVAAFSADLATSLSEGALDAVEAFLVPDPGAEGLALRDGIAERLAGVACARVQTAFDPETGALELRGHVPDPRDRVRLANAVRAELGGALPVVDRLLELPRPQCEVLSGLAAAGIPQSTEQFTNPLIIGENSHARVYDFREGEVMQLDIGGADYDGWLYLDYYDSAGEVLHLAPNEAVSPVRLAARAVAKFGGGGAADVAAGRVRLEVGAPFGKDIAVALVTSAPLFDDLRPTREPIADYLAALALRVEDLRRRYPDFKAEWVYLFISTAP
jgi:hypothetical protein